jgi:1-deoxy-D-xylulose-5-phosphate reductoisomerase
VLNAADEIAVAAFLDERIGFRDIAAVVAETLETVEHRELESVDDVIDVDSQARSRAAAVIAARS